MEIVRLLLGLLALLLGRSLFWLFVAIVGFFFGMEFAGDVVTTDSDLVLVGIAILAGVIGAVVAIVAKRLAFAVAGFFATSYFLQAFFSTIGGVPYQEIVVVSGGVIGAMAAFFIVDWALIVLSALVGSAVVTDELTLFLGIEAAVQMATFVGLLILGIGVQATLMKSQRRKEMLD